jgi:hypothetical protein
MFLMRRVQDRLGQGPDCCLVDFASDGQSSAKGEMTVFHMAANIFFYERDARLLRTFINYSEIL